MTAGWRWAGGGDGHSGGRREVEGCRTERCLAGCEIAQRAARVYFHTIASLSFLNCVNHASRVHEVCIGASLFGSLDHENPHINRAPSSSPV